MRQSSSFRSATLKLTLFYMAIIVAVSLFSSGVLYGFVTREFNEGLSHAYHFYDPDHDRDSHPTPDQDIANHIRDLWISFAVFNGAVVILASAGSYILARRTLKPLEEAHESETRFTADASHELRTPLAAIKAETEVALLDKKAPIESLRQTLTSNLEEITRLESLTNNLLNLSQLDKRSPENFEVLELSQLVEKATWQVDPLAKAKNIVITKKLTKAKVKGDQQMLRQLVVILLDNAIKYSSVKKPIKINLDKSSNQAELKIVDNGQGIKAKDLPHVFERFYRASNDRSTTEQPGFGLGLPLAKQITDLHHGSIDIYSQPEKGTTVIVKIPLS